MDLRCLDAHAHLGNLAFDHSPKEALRQWRLFAVDPGVEAVLAGPRPPGQLTAAHRGNGGGEAPSRRQVIVSMLFDRGATACAREASQVCNVVPGALNRPRLLFDWRSDCSG